MAMAVPAAAVATVTDATFPGGSLTGLTVDPAFRQGSIQNLSYRYEECGTKAAEKTCTWEVRANLFSGPGQRCEASTPESQLLWDGGEKSGNGLLESGPLSFALEGCKGQVLSVYYEAMKVFDPDAEEGPWKLLSEGTSASLFMIVIGAESSGEAAEQRIVAANPAAHPAPPPAPALAVRADCRSVRIGRSVYAFAYRGMGCHTATSLVTRVHLSGGAPSGYACKAAKGGGRRCWRRGHPEKYVEWHRRPANPAGRSR
jgi:hypothetical protein